MFSSVQTPEMAKKMKKDSAGADGSEKKRKREDGQQDASAGATAEPKRKKSKKHQPDPIAPPTPATEDEMPAVTAPAPVEKSVKKKRKAAQDGQDGNELSTKRQKKIKKAPSGAGTKPADGPSTVPGAATDATPSKKRKKNDQQHAVPEEFSTHTSVLASSSKGLSFGQQHDEVAEESMATLSDDELLVAHSPFEQQTRSFYVTLSPCASDFPLKGVLAEHISPILLTYFPLVKGVVMGYSNARLSEDPDDIVDLRVDSGTESKMVLSKAIDEYAVTYVWLTVDLSLFRPSRGMYVEGYVNLQNESMLGLVCYNYFIAGIEWQRLPKDWRWVAEEDAEGSGKRHGKEGTGYWVDGSGTKVEGRLVFRARDFEMAPGSEITGAGTISILGTLLSEEVDRRLDDEERQQGLVNSRAR